MLYSFFCRQKTIKNRLHEIIRTSSVSIIFAEFSFKPVYPYMVVKNFKFMENYNSWKMYLQVKILTLDILTHMVPPRLLPPPPQPPFPLSPLQSQLSSRFYHHLSGDHDVKY